MKKWKIVNNNKIIYCKCKELHNWNNANNSRCDDYYNNMCDSGCLSFNTLDFLNKKDEIVSTKHMEFPYCGRGFDMTKYNWTNIIFANTYYDGIYILNKTEILIKEINMIKKYNYTTGEKIGEFKMNNSFKILNNSETIINLSNDIIEIYDISVGKFDLICNYDYSKCDTEYNIVDCAMSKYHNGKYYICIMHIDIYANKYTHENILKYGNGNKNYNLNVLALYSEQNVINRECEIKFVSNYKNMKIRNKKYIPESKYFYAVLSHNTMSLDSILYKSNTTYNLLNIIYNLSLLFSNDNKYILFSGTVIGFNLGCCFEINPNDNDCKINVLNEVGIEIINNEIEYFVPVSDIYDTDQ